LSGIFQVFEILTLNGLEYIKGRVGYSIPLNVSLFSLDRETSFACGKR